MIGGTFESAGNPSREYHKTARGEREFRCGAGWSPTCGRDSAGPPQPGSGSRSNLGSPARTSIGGCRFPIRRWPMPAVVGNVVVVGCRRCCVGAGYTGSVTTRRQLTGSDASCCSCSTATVMRTRSPGTCRRSAAVATFRCDRRWML